MRWKRAQKSRIIIKVSIRQVHSRRGPEALVQVQSGRGLKALISLPLTLVLIDRKPPKNSLIGENGRLLMKNPRWPLKRGCL